MLQKYFGPEYELSLTWVATLGGKQHPCSDPGHPPRPDQAVGRLPAAPTWGSSTQAVNRSGQSSGRFLRERDRRRK